MSELDFSAVVLAGGQSLRMGRDKAWIHCGGETLIERALNLCRALGPREIFISGRPGEDYSALGCPVLRDLEPGNGPLGGIERALQAACSPLVLVLAVDLPQMTAALLEKLLSRCDRLTGCVPRVKDRLEPLAAVYPSRCHVLAARVLADSRHSVVRFVEACLHEKAVRIARIKESEAAAFANCNTPEDLAGLRSASTVRW